MHHKLSSLVLGAALVLIPAPAAAASKKPVTPPNLAVGAVSGKAEVMFFNLPSVKKLKGLVAEKGKFRGGVSVAVGDVTGDGVADVVTGAGPGGSPYVRVFNAKGKSQRTFFAYDPSFRGGVSVAVGDVNGDGVADIVTGAGAGGAPHVRVFDGPTLAEIRSFYGMDPNSTSGINVAAGDTNNDDIADIIVAPKAGPEPVVYVYSGTSLTVTSSFYAFDASFRGGVNVAAADYDGDGQEEVICGAGAGGTPEVAVISGYDNTEHARFLAFDASFTGGVSVAAADVNADGFPDIVAGTGASTAPAIRVFNADGFALMQEISLRKDRKKFSSGVTLGGLQN